MRIERVGPGLYLDGDELHVNVPELLSFAGILDTEENRDIAVKAAVKAAKETYPGVPVHVEE